MRGWALRAWTRLLVGLVGGGVLLEGCAGATLEPREVAAQAVSGLLISFLNQNIQQAIEGLLGL